ncbi:DNA replication ATP-dependent helicase/nuclease JHS1 [Arachis hypogaea]|uniref:DNA replication ATP-dependent helicase/nuclease JHS1 n=1 Tax=Arachis hypogaea TaxID=3818 RepID=UPI000DECDD85|nr:DNA replication ATP-dependent helicase/nuclease DNA2 [Arachis hypogaea]
MPPKKKKNNTSSSSSASKKHNPQPSKFGIQHFFDRHTQNNALLASQKLQTNNASDSAAKPVSDPLPARTRDPIFSTVVQVTPQPSPQKPSDDKGNTNYISNNDNRSNNGPSQNTPTENSVVPVDNVMEDIVSEVSPDISKAMPLKRFKFSPGMFIKQTQDYGVDEVTWKISPVNERLQAVSKHVPNVIKALADSSRLNLLPFRSCSEDKTFRDKDDKVDELLTSPTPKASAKALPSMSKLGLKRINPEQSVDFDTNPTTLSYTGVSSRQSPFRTPPSLSHCPDKVHPINDIQCTGPSDQLYLRQHKKTLLELLDQVEDAIAVDDATVCNKGTDSLKCCDGIADELPVRANHAEERTRSHSSKEDMVAVSSSSYLVLQVSENSRSADSSAADARSPYKVLRLLNEQTGEERAVNLRDEWFFSVIAPGDTVNIIGQFDEGGSCDIGHENNFLIVHPDILLSGTRVAGSFGCLRRTVLDERLKCNEYSTAALTGTLLHQIFQAGLTEDNPSIDFLEGYTEVVLLRNIESLYACGVNESDVRKTLIDAVPRILSWILRFTNKEENEDPNVCFGFHNRPNKVAISEVIDIEEMAWAPKYGLKGMIDASVRVTVQSVKDELEEKIMPVEFKTGKSPAGQSSAEHNAQVILYTLLMSERYQNTIDSGLLYYLQSDQTQGIVAQRSDLVGLIMRRNELASDILKALTSQQLPPMLKSPGICKGCRHLNVCSIYHKLHGGSTKSSGLEDVFDSLTDHLTSSHSKFLCHWDRLIDLEAKETELLRKEMWRSHSLKAPNCGSLSSIVLDASYGIPHQKSVKDNRFVYRFVRQDNCPSGVSDGDHCSTYSTNLDLTLGSGDYVILSNDSSGQTIAKGVISDISQIHVSVSFSKRLRIPGRCSTTHDLLQQVWRIDKDEFVTSFASMRFNLAQLFLQNDRSTHLRRMIVDLEAPRFDCESIVSQDPAISYVRSKKSLNDDQCKAILKILAAKDYALILGMPGTGKTSTLVHAVKALLERDSSILLTAYTNSAVDNLLMKLKAQDIDFVRIGRPEAVHEVVRGHCLSATSIQNVEDIKIRLGQVRVVAVTCLGISSPLLANMRFDVCIMDEAGQTTLPVSLGPLAFASVFVLVGDHYQLPPLVQSIEARENGMGISLFCRLSETHPEAIAELRSQYRMRQGIMDLSNALIYGDRLRCGSSEIANVTLEFSNLNCGLPWLEDVLNPSRPVIFIDTDMLPALEVRDQKTVNNPVEAHIIAEVATELVRNGIVGEQIGVITPYNSQANLIRKAASETSMEIHTIDKYQGRDKDCILVSFVRSSENPTNLAASLLGDWHRINVALTRARKKLIMVGSRRTLSKVLLLKLLIKNVEEQCGIISVSKKDIVPKGQLRKCSQMG